MIELTDIAGFKFAIHSHDILSIQGGANGGTGCYIEMRDGQSQIDKNYNETRYTIKESFNEIMGQIND